MGLSLNPVRGKCVYVRKSLRFFIWKRRVDFRPELNVRTYYAPNSKAYSCARKVPESPHCQRGLAVQAVWCVCVVSASLLAITVLVLHTFITVMQFTEGENICHMEQVIILGRRLALNLSQSGSLGPSTAHTRA